MVKNKLIPLIIITSVIRLLVASLIELGNDEVYYWTYAIQPDWSHFDHPPMVGLLIRLTTLDLHWANEVSMRLGSIIGCALSTLFIFRIGKLLISERNGWYAALIYNCSVYTGFIAGLFILPDSPQMPFWTGALYVMACLVKKEKEKDLLLWLLLGALIGLATLCKVHALYLWAGFGMFIILKKSKWLLNWRLYAGVIITLLFLFPILYWNIINDFITYRYHSGRVTHTTIEWDMLGREIGGEFAYQNPVIFILIIVSVIALLRKRISLSNDKALTWLLCMSVPMILLFWCISLFNPTLPHWSGPAYIPLFFIAALYLEKGKQAVYPLFIKIAGALIIVVLVAGLALIRLSPVNFGSQEQRNYGEYCPTLDLSGWRDFSASFDTLVQSDRQQGLMKRNADIVVNKWFPGGHIEFYTSRKTGLPVIAIGELDDIHKFAWLNKERPALQRGNDAYAIIPSNLPFDVQAAYGSYFSSIEKPVVINQVRGGGIVRYFYIYRMHNYVK